MFASEGLESYLSLEFPEGQDQRAGTQASMRRTRSKSSITIATRVDVLRVAQVLEETGYDLGDQIKPADVVELSIRDQSLSLYIVPNVPEDYPFETRTRKEISVRSCHVSITPCV